jgi:hypothetical protein
MKTEATHIPATDPQCQALQGGYDAYAAGLILAASHTINRDASITSVGSWLVECQGRLANVHPVLGAWDSIQTHEGQRVYGVRFWL